MPPRLDQQARPNRAANQRRSISSRRNRKRQADRYAQLRLPRNGDTHGFRSPISGRIHQPDTAANSFHRQPHIPTSRRSKLPDHRTSTRSGRKRHSSNWLLRTSQQRPARVSYGLCYSNSTDRDRSSDGPPRQLRGNHRGIQTRIWRYFRQKRANKGILKILNSLNGKVAILTNTNYNLQTFKAGLFNLPNAKDQNLKQLQDAFRREISPEKWQRMRSARTLPFSWPAGGKVALKVVDHTGVEHLTVLDQPK